MGFWNKLGKIALTAAPYIAAPFTGGTSLALTGLANKGVQKWSQHDAAANAAKGLAPSGFDQALGKIGNYAGLASMFIPGGQLGALGKAGSAASKVAGAANKVSNFQKIMGGISAATGGGYNPGSRQPMDEKPWGDNTGIFGRGGYGGVMSDQMNPDGSGGLAGSMGKGGWQSALGDIIGKYAGSRGSGSSNGSNQGDYSYGRGQESSSGKGTAIDTGYGDISGFQRRMRGQLGPIMGRSDQSNPNLALSIGAGRMDALRNQPWRSGYNINTQPTDDSGNNIGDPMSSSMPPIYPTGQRRRQMAY